jgi:GNAT superfamily N-acetyltransferase
MSVVIRTANVEDAAGLSELAAATFGLACPPHTSDEDKADFIARMLSEQRFTEYLSDTERQILLAEWVPAGDEIDPQAGALSDSGRAVRAIGYTMLVFADPTDADVIGSISIRPSVELNKCYVRQSHHSAGVAATLMAESLDAARSRGAIGVWLGVSEVNERAKRFYAKSGFEHVGSRHFSLGGRLEDDWVMERAL